MINDAVDAQCTIKHNIVFCFLSYALEPHVWYVYVCMQNVKKQGPGKLVFILHLWAGQ